MGSILGAPGRIAAAVLSLTLALTMLSACAASPAAKKAGEDAAPKQAAGSEQTELEVYYFEAGKADAILLTTAGSAVLIDAGEKGFGKTILEYLEERGIQGLDYLIITHFDQDHVGGAAKVLNNIPVGTVLQSNSPKDSTEYEKYVKALANAKLEAITVSEAMSFTLDGVSYQVDPPRQVKYSEDSSNNSSLIVTVENGANRFLFLGDAQTERLAEVLDGGGLACDVLKVPHHGKEEPLMEALLQAAAPAWAVITSSDEEPESDAVTAALEAAGAKVLLTRQGGVTIRSDGRELTVQQ